MRKRIAPADIFRSSSRRAPPNVAALMKYLPLCFRLAVLASTSSVFALLGSAADNPVVARQGYTVDVELKVNDKGETESVSLVDSEDTSTGQVLSKMAMAMAMKTKLPIREKDGHPIAYTARAPFFFPVEDDEGPAAQTAFTKPRGKIKEAIQPSYPPALQARGEVGGVILELLIDAEGNISRLTTLRASNPEFEQAAVTAVKTWKFHPSEKDGKPVASRWRLAVVFDTSDRMADLKWRIAPRPSLGSFVVYHDTAPVATPAPTSTAPASTATPAVAAPAAPVPAAAETPAK